MDTISKTVCRLLEGCRPEHIEVEARIRRQLVNIHSAQLLINSFKNRNNSSIFESASLLLESVSLPSKARSGRIIYGCWEKSEYLERRKISKNNRKCTYRSRQNVVTGIGEHICKSSIAKEDIFDMWCTVHVSVETPMPSMQHALDGVQPVKVTRHRTTINGHYVDIIAQAEPKLTTNGDEVRVEIEACDAQLFESCQTKGTSGCAAEEMMDVVKLVCTALQGTGTFLPFYDWKTLMHVFGASFGPFCIDKKKFQKPRTLTIDALLSIADTLPEGWTVTPKVDGVRRFLVTVNESLFSLGAAKEVAYVHHCPTSIGNVTIIDCEYAHGVYYAFDMPVYDGAYCGDTTLDNRTAKLADVVNKMAGLINICAKPYETFTSFDRLKTLYEHFDDNYNIDGIIFSPKKGNYMQPVPKWKMHSTVDLEVKCLESGEQVVSTCDGFTVNMEFTLTRTFFAESQTPLSKHPSKARSAALEIPELTSAAGFAALPYDFAALGCGKVFHTELKSSKRKVWLQCRELHDTNVSTNLCMLGVWEFDFDGKKLIAKRCRPDKAQANSKHIVEKNMFGCVPGTLFTGKSFYLMRKYHNRIKNKLIKDANDFKAVIMDIGTGQGGDIEKWKRAKLVYCVEPNQNSLREMLRRCDNDKRMVVINAKLSDIDHDDIHEKIDIFIAFFCMNQWGDTDWKMLEYVIKNKGSTKCRLLVTALTNPKEHDSDNFKIVRIPNKNCKIMPSGSFDSYNVSIYDTRIVDIDETIVTFDDLTKLAKKCGMHQVKHERLNANDFMTWEEKRLSSMYSLFVYSK